MLWVVSGNAGGLDGENKRIVGTLVCCVVVAEFESCALVWLEV